MPERIRVSQDSFARSTRIPYLSVTSEEPRVKPMPWLAEPRAPTCDDDSSITALWGQQMYSFEALSWSKSASTSVGKDQYRPPFRFKILTLAEARESALRDLHEAEERRRIADKSEADFVGKLLDLLDEEE